MKTPGNRLRNAFWVSVYNPGVGNIWDFRAEDFVYCIYCSRVMRYRSALSKVYTNDLSLPCGYNWLSIGTVRKMTIHHGKSIF